MKLPFALALAATAILPGPGAAQPDAPAPAPRLTPAALMRVIRLEPGRWQARWRILDVRLTPATPGTALSPDAVETARESIGSVENRESCIGAGLAADGALILPGIRFGAERCRYSALEAANGRLRLASGCDSPQLGVRVETRIDATYTRSTMAGTIESTAHIGAGSGTVMRTTLRFDSSRAGACR